MVEDEVVSAHEFRGDDAGYLSWLVAHSAGYVINIGKNYNATGARMHPASRREFKSLPAALPPLPKVHPW